MVVSYGNFDDSISELEFLFGFIHHISYMDCFATSDDHFEILPF